MIRRAFLGQRSPVRIHQDDDRRIVSESYQCGARIGDRRIRLAGHQQGVLVDGTPLRLEHLRPEPADLLFPFAAELPQFGEGLVLVEIDHPRRPSVGDRQVVEGVQNPGEALGRETLDRDAADEPVTEPRRIARP
jgi:hypothetical protein